MTDRTFLDWPFFDDRHRTFAADLEAWADRTQAVQLHGDHDLDGVLSFEEFRYLVDGQDIEAKLQLSLHSSSSSSQPGGP